MSFRALILDKKAHDEISRVIKYASANPVPPETFLSPSTGIALAEDPRLRCTIPIGFTCAFTFERQPLGLCRHLSISVEAPFMLPHEQSAVEIASAFGFRDLPSGVVIFVEDVLPGLRAVNFIQVVEENQKEQS